MGLSTIRNKIVSASIVMLLVFTGFVGLIVFDGIVDDRGVEAATLTVGQVGSGAQYSTVQDAIDNASVGDTIYVWEGIYYENVVVNKKVTLIGNGTTNTTIDGGGSGYVILISSDWVEVRNLTINNSGFGSLDAGVAILDADNCRLENLNCSDNNKYGIRLYQSDGSIIENTTCINNSYNGIYLGYSNSNTVSNCNIYLNGRHGVCIYTSTGNTVDGNTIGPNLLHGIFMEDSTTTTITDNNMVSEGVYLEGYQLQHWSTHTIASDNSVNGEAVYYWKDVDTDTIPSNAGQVILIHCENILVANQNLSGATIGIILYHSNNNTIDNSVFNSNKVGGIELFSSSHNTISGSTCGFNNGDGLYLESSSHNIISDNTFSYNMDEGLDITATCDSNKIDNNVCNSNNDEGIRLSGGKWNLMVNNTCNFNVHSGIALSYCDENRVNNNNCSANGDDGIYTYKADHSTIMNNTCCSSIGGDGINMQSNSMNAIVWNNTCSYNYDDGIHLSSCYQTVVEKNICHSNGDDGIYLDSPHVEVLHNTISNNDDGIIGINADWCTILGNTIDTNSDYGVWLSSESFYNYIYHNNILNNGDQGVDDGSNYWGNGYGEGNHWSDYSGLDNGADGRDAGDGIGDTQIPHLGLDFHPFIEADGWSHPGIPELIDPGEIDINGHYDITWNSSRFADYYILEECQNESFNDPITLYDGPARSHDVFGRSERIYYYRVKAYNNYPTTRADGRTSSTWLWNSYPPHQRISKWHGMPTVTH